MADQNVSINRGGKWMRIVARILATLWFGFWVFFSIASGMEEGGKSFIYHLIGALVCAVLLLMVWFWEKVGSIIIIAFSLLFAIVYPIWAIGRLPLAAIIPTEIIMVLPLLLAGILLVLYRRQSKTAPVTPLVPDQPA